MEITQEMKGNITRHGFSMLECSRNKFVFQCNNPKCDKYLQAKGVPKNWEFKTVYSDPGQDYEVLCLFCSKECKHEALKPI